MTRFRATHAHDRTPRPPSSLPARSRRTRDRRRYARRRAAPAPAARRAARGPRAHPGSPPCRIATARWSRRWSASVLRRLGTLRHICSAAISSAACRPTRRGSRPRCCSAPRRSCWLEVPDHAAVDLSVRLVQADRHAARYAGLVNAVLRRDRARRRAAVCAATDTALLDTPDWLMARWIDDLWRATSPAPSPQPTAHEPALDLTVKSRSRATGPSTLGGRVLPTGTVRAVAHGPVSPLPGYAEAPGGCRTPPPRCRRGCSATCSGTRGRRSLRRARRQDRAARRRRRPGHRRRPLAHTARAAAAEPRAARPHRRNRRRRRRRMARRAVRRRPARRAVLVDRHHPPPSRHSLAQAREGHRGARGAAAPAARRRVRTRSSPAARWSIAPARSSPRKASTVVRDCSPQSPRVRRRPIADGEAGVEAAWLTPEGDLRTLPCHLAGCRSAHGRARRLLCRPAMQGYEGFTASWPGSRRSAIVAAGGTGRPPKGEASR